MSTATKTSHKTKGETAVSDQMAKNGSRQTTSPMQGWQTGLMAAAPVVSLGQPIQTKLAVGPPNDAYEQEADTVAEQVVTGQSGGAISRLPAASPQRQEEEEAVQDDVRAAARGRGSCANHARAAARGRRGSRSNVIRAAPRGRRGSRSNDACAAARGGGSRQTMPGEEEEAVQTIPVQRQEEEETIQRFRGGVPRVPGRHRNHHPEPRLRVAPSPLNAAAY